jgi:hypothetical protein
MKRDHWNSKVDRQTKFQEIDRIEAGLLDFEIENETLKIEN